MERATGRRHMWLAGGLAAWLADWGADVDVDVRHGRHRGAVWAVRGRGGKREGTAVNADLVLWPQREGPGVAGGWERGIATMVRQL